jgi:hypothetical protein
MTWWWLFWPVVALLVAAAVVGLARDQARLDAEDRALMRRERERGLDAWEGRTNQRGLPAGMATVVEITKPETEESQPWGTIDYRATPWFSWPLPRGSKVGDVVPVEGNLEGGSDG